MKILYHQRTLGDGAEGIHIKEMVEAFRSLGHEVLLVGPAKNQNLGNSTKNSPLNFIKRFVRGPAYEFLEIGYNVYNYYSLARIVSKFRPDFIYDRYITFNYSCVAFGLHHNIPVFLEVNSPLAYERDHEEDESLYLRKMAYFIEKHACSNTFKTIVVSTPLKEYLVSIGVPEKKILVLPNGVNIEKFRPQIASNSLRKSLGICNGDIVIGFVGILRPWHGIDLLMDTFKVVHDKYPNTKLLLIGDGPIRDELENRSKQSGFQNQIIITGRVPHERVCEYVVLFDIAVSPKATFYASPMKIPEYMAQRKAVIAPDTENIKDLITHGSTGILFKDGSKEALVNSLLMMISNPSKSLQIGSSAYDEILHRLNWKASAKKIEEIYLDRYQINEKG